MNIEAEYSKAKQIIRDDLTQAGHEPQIVDMVLSVADLSMRTFYKAGLERGLESIDNQGLRSIKTIIR